MKNIAGKVIILVLTVIFIILLLISYFLSYLITEIGGVIVLLVMLYTLTSFLTNLLVFPGSYKFWLRMVESNFSRELSTQSMMKLTNLIAYLQCLKNPSYGHNFTETTIRLFQKLISTLINNFTELESQNIITDEQKELLYSLQILKINLKCADVNNFEGVEISVWELIENPENDVFIGKADEIDKCILACENVIRIIGQRANRGILRGGFLLGTDNYMRVDLLRRFKCEQFWVNGADGIKLDCVWISGFGATEISPVIVFCNPNAAYYEFAYFQTDWIELYVSAGVNLVMWNYRGYGRSAGKPNLKLMKIDGENLIDYLRNQKKCKFIGVHGESLGGTIASHLGTASKLDFLFADRTFASLSNTAKYKYGKLAAFVFRIVGPQDSNSVKDFIKVECPKLMSCDCNDIMINNLGSLKAGVASEYYKQLRTDEFVISDKQITNVTKAMEKIQQIANYKAYIMKKDKKKIRRGYLECANLVENLLLNLEDIIDKIDAGGEKFIDLFVNPSEYRLTVWLYVLGIWGSTPEIYSSDHNNNFQSAFEKLSRAADDMKIMLDEFNQSSNQDVIKCIENVNIVKEFLEKIRDWVSGIRPNEGITGKLLPLNCGHNGPFSSLERYLYEQFLQSAGLI
ncbi:hypothetical protein SteCoe_2449 [Stentor coeruleus]|uniref:Serine aminopeptidase S33 domain-containing protein n=1 Tax=Stentor coeruleus TaxID=5963 RepID=A0A1R2CZG0_9CILI|nr:hypothetical protein SteCoe_2449 [Stentor coeruleus]